MKTVARDIRDLIVHNDVISDYVHRQAASGSTAPDYAIVLENRSTISGYQNYSMITLTEEHVSDYTLPRDRNRNWKSIDVGSHNADNDNATSKGVELLPALETEVTTTSCSSKPPDGNNNSRLYSSCTANDFAERRRGLSVSGRSTSAGNRILPRSTVRTTAKTTPTRYVADREDDAGRVRSRTQVVCVVAPAHDDEVLRPTMASDRSNYSGVYERDLDHILESAAEVGYHLRRRRRRRSATAFPPSRARADEFYFRSHFRRPAHVPMNSTSGRISAVPRTRR